MANRTPAELLAYCLARPGLAIGFPIWVANRRSAYGIGLDIESARIYEELGLVCEVIPTTTGNNTSAWATPLGLDIAEKLAAADLVASGA